MQKIIQCSCLGNYGRFGNFLFQYCFAKAYAEKYNAVLEIPANWIGRKIFKNINNPSIRNKLPKTKSDEIIWGKTNIDLYGYFQHEEAIKILNLEKIKKWLQFKDCWEEKFSIKAGTYNSIHIRRGDYVSKFISNFCVVSENSYTNCIKKYNINCENMITVSEENPHKNEFAEIHGVGFLYDFFLLKNSKIMLRANSTFSLWAGILGNCKVYSPVVDDKVGIKDVEFIEGNYPKCVDNKNINYNKKYSDFDFLK